jgi:site-specific recombinase
MNYSLGFMLVHVLHFTIATKQPAMTAARIAAALHESDQKGSKKARQADADSMAALINKVFRTQVVAVLGNLATVIPIAFLLALGYWYLFGHHLVNPEKARHLIHDSHPWESLALLHAAIAGVWLFVSGLVSGYYDNKALYTRMGQRVQQLHGLRRLLGRERLARFGRYLEDNLGGLMGNAVFGVLMGTTATVGFLLGLPLDIRHVTFSSANLAIGFVGLDYQIDGDDRHHRAGHRPDRHGQPAGQLRAGAVGGAARPQDPLLPRLQAAARAGPRLRAAPLDFFIGPKDVERSP